MVRILHFADLHLGRAASGGVPCLRRAPFWHEEPQRAALRRVVDLALELGVDALTAGGDLYEHAVATVETGEFIARQFSRLAPRPVLVAPGNHDPFVEGSLYQRQRWPDNVVIFEDTRWRPVELSSGIRLWGVGHDRRELQENVLQTLRLDPGARDIALLHGWDEDAGPRREIAHCPFTVDDVERSGAAYVLLGHYHTMRLWQGYGYPGPPTPLDPASGAQGHVLLLTADGAAVQVEALPMKAAVAAAGQGLELAVQRPRAGTPATFPA